MSIKMQPGRWKQRDGRTAIVQFAQPLDVWPWKGVDADGEANSWSNDGCCLSRHSPHDSDLIECLGPLRRDT